MIEFSTLSRVAYYLYRPCKVYVFTVVSNQQCDWTEFVLGREIPPYHIGKHEITNVISTAVFTKCDNCFRLNKKEARKSCVIELRMGFGITHFKR
jgi:hypothetical protein